VSLKANIVSMDLPVARPEVRSPWLRQLFRMPPLEPRVRLIGELCLEVKPSEVLTLVGESGAGKTTLLRILAGLETRFDGKVQLGGTPIRKPDKRLYLMPQEHTLLPWFTVERNLLFFASRGDGTDPRKAIDHILKKLRLDNRRHAYPNTLSGGERARVALGCAMIAEPDVLLLDEPFRSLDQVTKERCEDDLVQWLDETERREAVVIVSHSVSDAVFLGDRLIVVGRGPLSAHREFRMPSRRVRRSTELLELEAAVLDALNEVAAQQRPADAGR